MQNDGIEHPRADQQTATSGSVVGAFLVGYFLRLGTFGFGGPIALAGHMQQDLVEKRRWISKQDYVEGLALAQLPQALWPPNSRFISATSVTEFLAPPLSRSRLSCLHS